jgi:hypothetical protein
MAKQQTDVVAPEAPQAIPENAAPRMVPQIKPSACKWQAQGFAYREMFVRLPAGLTIDDLNAHSATIWRAVQGVRGLALQRLDRVVLVGSDESWLAEGIVSFADGEQVVLAGMRQVRIPERVTPLYRDERFAVEFRDGGYAVIRLSDNYLMANQTWPTAAAAKEALLRQYSPRAA